ncbi:hypothetical protein K435DRAFT_967734 [Dendrothele bispora CBS 962.96]|uniref:Uncharacterized protein n=1 Tax=Dendrothele bispora (strain CBS 962.96) TaxID=1314807 RepID=A0A4S8LT87_DENBC|nr:hypothetical protein K435DRAFT_967734 [Dendrothele bispora CBS 962.96]
MAQQPLSTGQFVVLSVESIFYGIYVMSFVGLIITRKRFYRLSANPLDVSFSRSRSKTLLIIAVIVLLLATVDFALSLRIATTIVKPLPTLNMSNTTKNPLMWIGVTKVVEYVMIVMVGHLLLIYWCYLVWDKSKSIIILPILLAEAQTAVGIVLVYFQVTSHEDLKNDLSSGNPTIPVLQTCMLILNIFTSLSMNIAILCGVRHSRHRAPTHQVSSLLPKTRSIDAHHSSLPVSPPSRSKSLSPLSPVYPSALSPYTSTTTLTPTSPQPLLRPYTDSRIYSDSRQGVKEHDAAQTRDLYLHSKAQNNLAKSYRCSNVSKTGCNGGPRTRLLRTVVLLVHSGVLFTISAAVLLVLHVVHSEAGTVMWNISTQIIGITTNFVLFQCMSIRLQRNRESSRSIHFSISQIDRDTGGTVTIPHSPNTLVSPTLVDFSLVSPTSPSFCKDTPTTLPLSSSHMSLPKCPSSSSLSATFSHSDYNSCNSKSSLTLAPPSPAYMRSPSRSSDGNLLPPRSPQRSTSMTSRLTTDGLSRPHTPSPGIDTPRSRFSMSDSGSIRQSVSPLSELHAAVQRESDASVERKKWSWVWELLRPFSIRKSKDESDSIGFQGPSATIMSSRLGMDIADRHELRLDATTMLVVDSDISRVTGAVTGAAQQGNHSVPVSRTATVSSNATPDVIYRTPAPTSIPTVAHGYLHTAIPPSRQPPESSKESHTHPERGRKDNGPALGKGKRPEFGPSDGLGGGSESPLSAGSSDSSPKSPNPPDPELLSQRQRPQGAAKSSSTRKPPPKLKIRVDTPTIPLVEMTSRSPSPLETELRRLRDVYSHNGNGEMRRSPSLGISKNYSYRLPYKDQEQQKRQRKHEDGQYKGSVTSAVVAGMDNGLDASDPESTVSTASKYIARFYEHRKYKDIADG